MVVRIRNFINVLVADDAHQGGDAGEDTESEDGNNGDLLTPGHLQGPDDEEGEGRDGAGPVHGHLHSRSAVTQDEEAPDTELKTHKSNRGEIVIDLPLLPGGFLKGAHVDPEPHDDGAEDGEDVCQDLARSPYSEWLNGRLFVGYSGNVFAAKVVDGLHRGGDGHCWRKITGDERNGCLRPIGLPYCRGMRRETAGLAMEF